MLKQYIVRFVQDPTGLRTPVLDLWCSEGFTSSTLYDTEEEAIEDAQHDPLLKRGYYLMVIPVYVRPPERKRCYQCGNEVAFLFTDSRCGDCTRETPESLRGEVEWN